MAHYEYSDEFEDKEITISYKQLEELIERVFLSRLNHLHNSGSYNKGQMHFNRKASDKFDKMLSDIKGKLRGRFKIIPFKGEKNDRGTIDM